MTNILLKIIIFMLASCVINTVYAKDLGVVGDVYDILEEDLLQTIENRYHTMKESGEWQKLQAGWQKQVVQYADRPTPVKSVSTTLAARTFSFDPSITLSHDVLDAEGHVIAASGTTVNPLKMLGLHKTLLFIDADDDRQLIWAKKQDKALQGKTKWILVKGSVSEASKAISAPVYFDQGGKLVNHFNIKHVPAKLYQEDLHLKIEECLP